MAQNIKTVLLPVFWAEVVSIFLVIFYGEIPIDCKQKYKIFIIFYRHLNMIRILLRFWTTQFYFFVQLNEFQ